MPDTIRISDIRFDDAERQRQDLDPDGIAELAQSIVSIAELTGTSGLLNPIIVDRSLRLITGRRRIEAHKLLGREEIEAKFFEELDELERAVIEFDENHKRKQLTWQEESQAVAKIHNLQASRSGVGSTGRTEWGIEDTAKLLNISLGKVGEDLQLSKVLTDPRVSNRPSRRGALTTMKRVRELELVQELARRRAAELGIDRESSALAGGRLYNADCRDILKKMAPDSVDLIAMDPPWGVNFDQSAQWTKKFVKTYEDDQLAVMRMLTDVVPLLFRVLRPASHLYAFFPVQDIQWWTDTLLRAGFFTRARPLIWFKSGAHAMTDMYTEFRPTYETLLFTWKPGNGGVKRLFNMPIDDGYSFPRQPTDFHENEKPVEMMKRYIEASSNVGEIVLDPFSGGGSILAAAYEVGRYFIGAEVDEVHYTKAERRLKHLEDESVAGDE